MLSLGASRSGAERSSIAALPSAKPIARRQWRLRGGGDAASPPAGDPIDPAITAADALYQDFKTRNPPFSG